MSTIRDQHYFGGALLDLGFADTRGQLRQPAAGQRALRDHALRQSRQLLREPGPALLPAAGDRQPVSADAHFLRHASLEIRHGLGARELSIRRWRCTTTKCCATMVPWPAMSLSRAALSDAQELRRRAVSAGSLDAAGRVFRWKRGVRAEWNEIVRDLEVAPRLAVAWAPKACAAPSFPRAGASTTTPSAWARWRSDRTRPACPPSSCRTATVQGPGADRFRGESTRRFRRPDTRTPA